MPRGPERDLVERYITRLRPKPVLVEVADARGDPGEITRREAVALLAAVPDGAMLVALDLGGRAPDSEALAGLLTGWRDAGRAVCFVLGGAEGLHASVIARAEYVLSFGALTWPHMLARAMLAEQMYRAQCIAGGHPYHRAGRP
jgi:23S rRNA (pseudouridine1915-N3)-methyltransferase